MLIIAEKINATRKSVKRAVEERNAEFLRQLALTQVEAGADYVDVNVATGGGSENEPVTMAWAVGVIQEAVDKPLVIDSADPATLRAGLEASSGSVAMINSVNGETDRLDAVLGLAGEFGSPVVALAMDDRGIPNEVDVRLEICARIAERAAGMGVPQERLFFDPLVVPVSTDCNQGCVTLDTLRGIKERLPQAKTTVGLSNVSFGLPSRGLVNRTLLVMAIAAGLDSAIVDPTDKELMAAVYAGEAVAGRDEYCMQYIQASRSGMLS